MLFIASVLGLIKRLGFLYRIIGVVICFVFFGSNLKDLMFTASSDVQELTMEALSKMSSSEVPRYMRITDASIFDGTYVSTEDEDGNVQYATYPVYAPSQLLGKPDVKPWELAVNVVVKDKKFDLNSMQAVMTIDGFYDGSSFTDTREILEQNGFQVSPDAILVVIDEPPSAGNAALWTGITGLLGGLLAASFIPSSLLGLKEEEEVYEEEYEEEREEIREGGSSPPAPKV